MNKISLVIAGAMATSLAGLAGAEAAEQVKPPRLVWSFSGPFGAYDRAQLQRGFKVYREVCSNCHAISRLFFRNLSQPGGPGFSDAQVDTLAAQYKIKDGPNDQGEMFERPGRASDSFPPPFPNENAARTANGGAYPPDFSLLAKARTYERGFPWFIFDIFTQYQEQGPDYIHALMVGYEEPPKDEEMLPGQYWNEFMPNHRIAMPKPLSDGQVDFKDKDGKPTAPETVDQYAKDVAAFMMWAAEPHLEARKATGFKVMIFLVVFAGLMYFTKKKIWARVHGDEAHA
jgi:ubiquinol-cytochrome c reductase cytochrome c1 subunit